MNLSQLLSKLENGCISAEQAKLSIESTLLDVRNCNYENETMQIAHEGAIDCVLIRMGLKEMDWEATHV